MMLPKKLHLEQINRFHNKFKELDDAIESCGEREDLKAYKGELTFQYFKLTKLWNELDNFIEMEIKHTLDYIDDSN